jgi:uncharacterized membrane protein YbhN (UPF0104 family)
VSGRRGGATFLLSLLLSVGLVGYLFSRIELTDLTRTLAGIHLPSLAAYAVLALLAAGLRAARYRVLIGSERIGFRPILLVTLIRNLFVDLLPAGLGSLSYIYLVVRRLGLPLELGTSTFVLAAVFDALALSPLLLLAIVVVGLGRTAVSGIQFAAAAAAFLLAGVLLLVYLIPILRGGLAVGVRLLEAVGLGDRWRVPYLVEKARLSVAAVDEIQRRGVYTTAFVVSFLLRLAKYGSLYFLLHALLANQGFPLATLSFWKVLLGIAAAEMSANLPIQGIAGLGTWETAFALAFRVMGYEEKVAIVAGLGLHLVTQVFEYGVGGLAILLLAWPPRRRPPGTGQPARAA